MSYRFCRWINPPAVPPLSCKGVNRWEGIWTISPYCNLFVFPQFASFSQGHQHSCLCWPGSEMVEVQFLVKSQQQILSWHWHLPSGVVLGIKQRLSEKFAYYHYINVTTREAILYLIYFISFLRRSGETKRALVLRRNVVSPLIVIFIAPQIRRWLQTQEIYQTWTHETK